MRFSIILAGAALVIAGTQAVAQNVSQDTRVLPKHIFDERVQTQDRSLVQPGYRPLWEDGRLNPRRGEQSLRGIAQNRLVWTQTVPSRLIDRKTGRDVTNEVFLVDPATGAVSQRGDLGTVTIVDRNGQLIP